MDTSTPLLYGELAPWWHLFSAPGDYEEEARLFAGALARVCPPGSRLLELGSGGGNNASHMKARYQLTLVDRSPRMLEQSRRLNPELEHLVGDMRTVRLGRTFDAVFIHDAVAYLTTEEMLAQTFATAAAHLDPGGSLLVVPDSFTETFTPSTDHGGDDDGARGIRYLEWTWDPDPSDTTVVTDFAYLVRDADGSVRAIHDRHVTGLFPRATWLSLAQAASFDARIVPFPHSELPPDRYAGILGTLRA